MLQTTVAYNTDCFLLKNMGDKGARGRGKEERKKEKKKRRGKERRIPL
jgi:hypothetical protein